MLLITNYGPHTVAALLPTGAASVPPLDSLRVECASLPVAVTRAEGLAAPTVHLNGTHRDELERQYAEAMAALLAAEVALTGMQPNGRDYYPQGGDALRPALAQHRARLLLLHAVMAEVGKLAEALA